MAIVKIDQAPSSPTGGDSWTKLFETDKFYNLGVSRRANWDFSGNTVKQGVQINIGGSNYQVTSDTAITGTPSAYVKITPTGIASYVSSLAGVAWNAVYNCWLDGTGNAYLFDAPKAGLGKTELGEYALDPYMAKLTIPGVLTANSTAVTLNKKLVLIDRDIVRNDNIGRTILNGGSSPSPTVGAYIITEGVDYTGVGAGGRISILPTTTADLEMHRTSDTGNTYIRGTGRTIFGNGIDNLTDLVQMGSNQDISVSMGKLKVVGLSSGSFYLAQYSYASPTTFNFAGTLAGASYINALSGQEVRILNNNAEIATFSGTAITMNKPVTIDASASLNLNTNAPLVLGANQGGGASLKYNSNGNLDIFARAGFNTNFTATRFLFNATDNLIDAFQVAGSGYFSGSVTCSSIDTGQGSTEVYLMNQNVRTTDAVTFATINTGQGANELYAMNQNVRSTDAVTFSGGVKTNNVTLKKKLLSVTFAYSNESAYPAGALAGSITVAHGLTSSKIRGFSICFEDRELSTDRDYYVIKKWTSTNIIFELRVLRAFNYNSFGSNAYIIVEYEA